MKPPKGAPTRIPKPKLHPFDAKERAGGNRPYAQEEGKVIMYVAVGDDVPDNMRYAGRVNMEDHGDLARWIHGPTEDLVRERAEFYGRQYRERAAAYRAATEPKPSPIKKMMVSKDAVVEAPPPPPKEAGKPFTGSLPGKAPPPPPTSLKPPSGLVPPKKG